MVEITTPVDSMATKLSNAGFTHVIVGIDLYKTWAKRVFQSDQLLKINHFFDADCKFVFAKNGYALFEIHH